MENKSMNLDAFFTINYGMYIITAKDEEKLNGQLANAVMQITAEPPQLALALAKTNLTSEIIQKTKKFSISALSTDASMKFLGLFGFKSGRDINKFENIKYKLSENKVPIVLENAVSYFECELENMMDVGTHYIFSAKVTDAQIIGEGELMTYNYYRDVRHGLSPKSAPTYHKPDNNNFKEGTKMKKYRCTVCGYIYDPDQGDPDSGIKPGTPFEDIPDDWVCPMCGVGKDDFEVVE